MKRFVYIFLGFLIIGIISAGGSAYATTSKSTPSFPRNIQIQEQNNAVFLTWEKPLAKNFSGFRIYRSKKPGKLGILIKTMSRNTFSFLDSNIQKDTTYFYTVRTFWKYGKKSTNKQQYSIKIPSEDAVVQEKLFQVAQGAPSTCTTLFYSGDPAAKINIVFIPDGKLSFEEYHSFIENFFTKNTAVPNFLNRQPFQNNVDQFNLYSIWKDADYQCGNGSSDCDAKMLKLAEVCPVRRAFDGITVLMPPVSFGTRGDSVGHFGNREDVYKSANPIPNATYTLTTGEKYKVNYCPGMTTMHLMNAINESSTTLLHELGHMIGDLSHSGERRTIMSELIPRSDYFDTAEIQGLCEKINTATGEPITQCTIH